MSSAGPAERRDPTCPSWPRQAEPPQLRLSTRLESSVRGQGRQGPRTRMLPPGDAPQRRMRTTPQLCHQARRSQAPACRSSSCRVCHGRCWEEAHLPERARGKTPGAATHSPQRPHPGTVTGLPDPLGFTPRSRPCRRDSRAPNADGGRSGTTQTCPHLLQQARRSPGQLSSSLVTLSFEERFVAEATPGF